MKKVNKGRYGFQKEPFPASASLGEVRSKYWICGKSKHRPVGFNGRCRQQAFSQLQDAYPSAMAMTQLNTQIMCHMAKITVVGVQEGQRRL